MEVARSSPDLAGGGKDLARISPDLDGISPDLAGISLEMTRIRPPSPPDHCFYGPSSPEKVEALGRGAASPSAPDLWTIFWIFFGCWCMDRGSFYMYHSFIMNKTEELYLWIWCCVWMLFFLLFILVSYEYL
jgi:hypothetical protein